MGSYAFYNNDALAEVTIHSSAFGNYAFRNCDKLAKVTFGSEVSVIGADYTYSYIFYDCPLQDVYCEATVPPTIQGYVFSNYSSVNLYVPAASMPQYREANYWRNFKFAMKESSGIYYEVLNESEVKKVGYRIREIRESKGMTQAELVEKSGITRTTIWKLEAGEDEVTTSKTLVKIADALGVTVGELFLPHKV
jgi:DNA-binding XRE family transcriptional regulator